MDSYENYAFVSYPFISVKNNDFSTGDIQEIYVDIFEIYQEIYVGYLDFIWKKFQFLSAIVRCSP
jgi:hypothetical protein